jgi:hypothetical protein
MTALQFEAIKVALKQDATGFVLTLKIHPDEIPESLMRDFVGARYAVALVRINEDETPKQYKTRVQQAGMLCRDVRFRQWVEAREGVSVKDEKDAVSWLYQHLNIDSRTELNGNVEAQTHFDRLLRDFKEDTENEPF